LKALDLYAKIEPLIGFYDEYEELYLSYFEILNSLHVEDILDLGCGNGKLLKHLKQNGFNACGIDRSQEMVNRALKLGVNASTKELLDFENSSFDCILAVADVLNYIKPEELCDFFQNISRALKDDGYFLFDINTLEGFAVADGVMVRDNDNEFLAIEANYEDKMLTTNIILFDKQNSSYKKYSDTIYQYYHKLSFFKNMKNMKLIKIFDISMFGDEVDKNIILLKNISK